MRPNPSTSIDQLEAIAKGKYNINKNNVSKRRLTYKQKPSAVYLKLAAAKSTSSRPRAAARRSSPVTSAPGAGRPPLPKLEMGPSIPYMTGRVLVSVPGRCFRTFKKTGDRVDHKRYWDKPSVEAAWDASLALIEAEHATAPIA